jgi:porphobilinogen synthase
MKRFRQFRATQEIRDRFADVTPIEAEDFIYPYFVAEGEGIREEIGTMKDIYRLSIDELLKDLEDTLSLGINKVLLFGVIPESEKDERGSAAYQPDNIISRALRAIKARFPQTIVFTDICLCEYTSHGHCGLLCDCDVDNDSTLPLLAEMAYQHAVAGADFVAPSAMMDGQIEALRKRLDEAGLKTKILAYSAKYASAFYGPFRDAAGSAPSFGDRKSYQMDYRTKEQGLEEIAADIEEGTDWIMVKPAMPYLDMLYRASQRFPEYPLVAYQVSGEYSMLLNGAAQGFFDEQRIFGESLTAIRRAGAKYIISYYAKKYVRNAMAGKQL